MNIKSDELMEMVCLESEVCSKIRDRFYSSGFNLNVECVDDSIEATHFINPSQRQVYIKIGLDNRIDSKSLWFEPEHLSNESEILLRFFNKLAYIATYFSQIEIESILDIIISKREKMHKGFSKMADLKKTYTITSRAKEDLMVLVSMYMLDEMYLINFLDYLYKIDSHDYYAPIDEQEKKQILEYIYHWEERMLY